jgi:hypothetical protein
MKRPNPVALHAPLKVATPVDGRSRFDSVHWRGMSNQLPWRTSRDKG